jgi:cell wall-associated NlpC family hydrolase
MPQASGQMRGKRLRTRIAATALVGATCVGAVATTFSTASAAPVAVPSTRARKVDPLAAVAVEALAELRAYVRSSDANSLAQYEATRDGIADEVALRLFIDPVPLRAAWDEADISHQIALMAAFTQLGVPYRRNQSREGVGFDCSGLTTYAWGVAGVTLTRQSGAQIRQAAPRDRDTAQAGDLAYYPGHVMLYLGVESAIVHAPYPGRTVEVDMVSRRRGFRFGDPLG